MYDTSIEVKYSNNTEFRESLRKVFKMNCIEEKENEVIDNESRDELLYDEERVNKVMTFVLDFTKNNTLFTDLYTTAAGRMLSTDIGIGLSILFSYDNLKLFHLLLRDFFSNPAELNEKTQSYIDLKKHIQ